MTAATLVKKLKAEDQDFEFYPTTDEIIGALVSDLGHLNDEYYARYDSLLDIGAGNGKVLKALKKATYDDDDVPHSLSTLYAIEKSTILCEQLDDDVLIVGTDFKEQSLLSKKVDVVFSNPPYSEYLPWAVKIIRQAACSVIYLVLPKRWQESVEIADALKYRQVEAQLIGEFDFEDSEDRKARAIVHLIRIRIGDKKDDAFERFFKEQFADLYEKFEDGKKKEDDDPLDLERPKKFGQLVIGASYPQALVNLYDGEMAHVERNYQLVGELDADLLREFEISPASIMKLLGTRLDGLKNTYWKELFSNLGTITDRLTAGSRSSLLDTLHRHVHVDFTVSNICVIAMWVIKNANRFIDSQLIDVYELMVEKCNVTNYKSNQKTWEQEGWRYCNDRDKNSHYALDYRIVAQHIGGMKNDSWSPGLEDRACDFIHDMQVIAKNLGFYTFPKVIGYDERKEWVGGEKYYYEFVTAEPNGTAETLFDVKAFFNGNLHLRLNQEFILALNVEYGRLKGWLRSGQEAVDELGKKKAAKYFQGNVCLMPTDLAMLPAPKEDEPEPDKEAMQALFSLLI